jgi:hypothetical protein
MSNPKPTPIPVDANIVPISLIPQTGMPPIYPSRSKELSYDCLGLNPDFVSNPFGPQKLYLSRPNHHW